MLCYHDTYSTNLTPCNLASRPVFALTSALALPAHSRTQLCCLSSLPLQQEKKEWDLGCTPHFLPPAAAVLPFPHITWQKSRVTLDVQWVEIRSVYERNIGKVGIFSSSRGDEKVFHCHFEMQLLLLNQIILIYSKMKTKKHLISGPCSWDVQSHCPGSSTGPQHLVGNSIFYSVSDGGINGAGHCS